MLKVFLVEDEVVIRNGIKNSIPWEKEGFTFAGEASDGELAYPLIKREKPDILITDIRMPFMDGLELSRIVKKEMPGIKIIILSGYNEFDYAKTAINIGVTDYLLKPISSAKLLEAVKKVGAMIEKEQDNVRLLERYEKEMEENIHMEKHRLWSAIVSNRLSTAELLENGQRLGMDFTASAYQIFLFKLMQGGDATGCSKELTTASDRVNAGMEQQDQVLTFDRSPEGWAFLIKGQSEEEIKERLENLKRDLVALAEEYPGLEYFGGVGSVVFRLGDIQNSYRDASKAFSNRFFMDANRVMESGKIPSAGAQERIDVSDAYSRKQEHEQIEKFFKSGTLEEVEAFLGELFLNIGEQNCRSLLYRQYVVMDLFFCASDFLKNLGIGLESLPEECRDINRIVAKASSPERLRMQMNTLFTEVIKLRETHSRKKYSELLEQAKTFIDENYQREDMSLNTVASRVNISPSYFSAIFSNEMGETFVEYLTRVRLEKAKELLMCSSMRTAEIGYEVGYKDSHYFSYIFKKVVGCSPKEYKNRK